MKILVITEGNAIEKMQTALRLLVEVAKIETPSFVRINGYSNDKSNGTELANYTLNLGIDYKAAKERDTVKLLGTEYKGVTEQARRELLDSAQLVTVENQRRSKAQTDAYINLAPNIRVHKATNRLFICGLLVSKEIVVKGEYAKVNSSDLTLEKRELQKDLSQYKFRQFALDKIQEIKVKGTEFIIEM